RLADGRRQRVEAVSAIEHRGSPFEVAVCLQTNADVEEQGGIALRLELGEHPAVRLRKRNVGQHRQVSVGASGLRTSNTFRLRTVPVFSGSGFASGGNPRQTPPSRTPLWARYEP